MAPIKCPKSLGTFWGLYDVMIVMAVHEGKVWLGYGDTSGAGS